MATTNIAINGEWQLIVAAGDEFLFTPALGVARGLWAQLFNSVVLEVAVVPDADPAPDAALYGHPIRFSEAEGMSRTLVGPGDVYARSRFGSVIAALTAWTPA